MTDAINNTLENSISRIAIAGSGFEAWLTAVTLCRSLGRQNIDVSVCPVPGSEALDALYSVLPAGPDDCLGPAGISNENLVQNCKASFSLGLQFDGQIKPFGKIGADFLGLAFHHHWMHCEDRELAGDYFSWSPATLAMKRNAFAPPVEQNAIGDLRHEVSRHVDIGILTSQLRERAIEWGAKKASAPLETVKRPEGSDRIAGLLTASGECIEADLYIDCTGPERRLIGSAPGASWAPAPDLPICCINIAGSERQDAPPPYYRVATRDEGWEIEVPGYGWEMRIGLATRAAGEEGRTFAPGHFSIPWMENCVGLGGAVASFLPMDPIYPRSLTKSLRRLLSLLPGKDCSRLETIEFNKLSALDFAEIEDFTAIPELARKLRLSEADFGALHPRLRQRMSLFTKRGWVTPVDSEFLLASEWAAALLLHGFRPADYDRLAERLPQQALHEYLRKLKTQIEKVVSEFPPHDDYLDAVRFSSRRSRPSPNS